jgi:spermidine synthase
LVGGLGMGYTLRAVLDALPPDGRVVVAELLPEVVRWNRDHLAELAHSPLDDSRVSLVRSDVAELIRARPRSFDAVLLDVDNGPSAFTVGSNEALYAAEGLSSIRRCLRPGGVLGFWSAYDDPAFEKALRRAGFKARSQHVGARGGGKGPRHTIFIAELR